jgi:tRNA pseudouridine13 synthase
VKVKQRAEDFRVEEVSRLEAGAEGDFALYSLMKRGVGTLEAVKELARAWRLDRDRIAFAGLKDRYGITVQTISVARGPARNFEGRGFRLNYLGRSPRAAGRGTMAKNRFRILLRDLSRDEAERVSARALVTAEHGFPDYYDDQRFGSVRGSAGRFVAAALLRGDPGEALRLAIATPSRDDHGRVRKVREALRRMWGDWGGLAASLPPSAEKRICERLSAGASFAEAYALLDAGLRSIYLSAFQAHLFNAGLRKAIGEGPAHPGLDGPYVFYEGDPGPLREAIVPLASGAAAAHPWLDAALEAAGFDREALSRLPFRPGNRAAVVVPERVEAGEPGRDELNAGRFALPLSFVLRPGSYATMLIKRCTWDVQRGKRGSRGIADGPETLRGAEEP